MKKGIWIIMFVLTTTFVTAVDINNDGTTDINDVIAILLCTNNPQPKCDLNNDNQIDHKDVLIVLTTWLAQITEPTTTCTTHNSCITQKACIEGTPICKNNECTCSTIPTGNGTDSGDTDNENNAGTDTGDDDNSRSDDTGTSDNDTTDDGDTDGSTDLSGTDPNNPPVVLAYPGQECAETVECDNNCPSPFQLKQCSPMGRCTCEASQEVFSCTDRTDCKDLLCPANMLPMCHSSNKCYCEGTDKIPKIECTTDAECSDLKALSNHEPDWINEPVCDTAKNQCYPNPHYAPHVISNPDGFTDCNTDADCLIRCAVNLGRYCDTNTNHCYCGPAPTYYCTTDADCAGMDEARVNEFAAKTISEPFCCANTCYRGRYGLVNSCDDYQSELECPPGLTPIDGHFTSFYCGDPNRVPVKEVCDRFVDNNMNGIVDEGCPVAVPDMLDHVEIVTTRDIVMLHYGVNPNPCESLAIDPSRPPDIYNRKLICEEFILPAGTKATTVTGQTRFYNENNRNKAKIPTLPATTGWAINVPIPKEMVWTVEIRFPENKKIMDATTMWVPVDSVQLVGKEQPEYISGFCTNDLPAPTNFKVVDTHNGRVTIEWDHVPGAAGYKKSLQYYWNPAPIVQKKPETWFVVGGAKDNIFNLNPPSWESALPTPSNYDKMPQDYHLQVVAEDENGCLGKAGYVSYLSTAAWDSPTCRNSYIKGPTSIHADAGYVTDIASSDGFDLTGEVVIFYWEQNPYASHYVVNLEYQDGPIDGLEFKVPREGTDMGAWKARVVSENSREYIMLNKVEAHGLRDFKITVTPIMDINERSGECPIGVPSATLEFTTPNWQTEQAQYECIYGVDCGFIGE
ncbi:hypothetical protein ACFL1B_03155 [Nanoarchaeota archaeon]